MELALKGEGAMLVNTKLVFVAVALAVAVAIAVALTLAIVNSQQSRIPRIYILNQNIEPAIKRWDNQSLIQDQVEYRDHWTGNASTIISIGSYSFNYTAKEPGTYEMYFVNAWENQDPVFISLEYSAPQRNMKAEALSIPYKSQMQFTEILEANESIRGNFNVTGHPNQGILFGLNLPKCSQSVSFSFYLANTGQESRSTSVELVANGVPVWSNSYFVESGRLVADSGTAAVDDCTEHSYNLQLKTD